MENPVPVPSAASPSGTGIAGPSGRIAAILLAPSVIINDALGRRDRDQTPGVLITVALYAFAGYWLLKRFRVI